MNRDILVCGVGGQGTVLASKLIASAAMNCGDKVHSAETIGMAQRGGSVTSHVRIGDRAFSPLIARGGADMILAFEPSEAVRNLTYLKEGGTVVVSRNPVKPVSDSLSDTGYNGLEMIAYLREKCDCVDIDGDELLKEFGSAKFLNIALLGIACGSGKLGISAETIIETIEKTVAPKFVEINKKVFTKAYKEAQNEIK